MDKRKNAAEQMFNDALDFINDAAKEIERYANNYTTAPETDLIETKNNIIVCTNLPGIKKEDISLDLNEDELKIKVMDHEDVMMEEGAEIRQKGRRYGKINRVIKLPERIIAKESNAKLENGVLTVTMPKAEKDRYEVKIE